MDERVSLVFSWDPRTKVWIKERGPEDAAPPPASPIDDSAAQTYFLDPQNGKWSSTILGLKARQIAFELKDQYRSPRMAGLALPQIAAEGAPEPKRSRIPLFAGIGVLVVLVGAGAFVAQAMLAPSSGPAANDGTNAPAATVAPSAAASASASREASAGPTTAPGTVTPVRTAAPTPPPTPQTIRLSTRLPDGTTIVYSGPGAVAQNSTFQGIFSAVAPSGVGGNLSITVYLGDPNTPGANTSVLGTRPDANGNYVLSIRAAVPKGAQRLSVIYGTTAGIFTLGSITVQ